MKAKERRRLILDPKRSWETNFARKPEKKEGKQRGRDFASTMEELFVAVLSMLLVAALIPLYLWKRRQDSQPPPPHRDEAPQVCTFFQLLHSSPFISPPKPWSLLFSSPCRIVWSSMTNCQAPRRETVARAAATRRMRRRPAASGASTSADPPATQEGFSHNSFTLIYFF